MCEPDILILVSQFSPLIPLAAALVSFRRLDRPLRFLALMFLLAAVTEAAAHYLSCSGKSNLWLIHLWTPLEYVLTILALAGWQRGSRVRRLFYWSIPVFLALVGLNKILLESFNNLDSYSRSIGSVALVAAAVLTFQRIILEPGDSLAFDPRLWASSAVLIYHAGTLAVFTLGRILFSNDVEAFTSIYTIHSVINIFTALLFAGGFLCRLRR